ncbi:hypothetical protein ACFXDE_09890 [Kitasatospora sp. NPDC059408]|uniref:hypothetical protein n=1 Tax=Kitasatospora sp. NPDC059408 TaxID=3346823 RepID=UPI003699245D
MTARPSNTFVTLASATPHSRARRPAASPTSATRPKVRRSALHFTDRRAVFRKAFDRLQPSAVYGAAARDLIETAHSGT